LGQEQEESYVGREEGKTVKARGVGARGKEFGTGREEVERGKGSGV